MQLGGRNRASVADRRLSVSSVGSEAMQHPPPATSSPKPNRLSVSSVGSEAMQRFIALTSPTAPSSFQYPRSDRRRCNAVARQPPPGRNRAFSILGRIGGDATHCICHPPSGMSNLSVSSVGSEAMQQPGAGGGGGSGGAFSILGRIGGDATSGPTWPTRPGRWSFSILGRIGGDATILAARASLRAVILSVSSVGSEAMQPGYNPLATVSGPHPFSILGRIGGDATLVQRLASTLCSCFQYPRSDRRRCNVL